MDDRPPMTARLSFDPGSYTRASTLISAYAFNDEATVVDLLGDDPRGLACALLVIVYSGLARLAELSGGSFLRELQDVGVAAAVAAAAEEES